MLVMDMIAEIRRRHWVGRESISSIARDLKLSRPTVRKHCRTQREPVYRREKQPTPRLGAFQEALGNWLRTERLLPKAQRRTARRLFEGLQGNSVSKTAPRNAKKSAKRCQMLKGTGCSGRRGRRFESSHSAQPIFPVFGDMAMVVRTLRTHPMMAIE